MTREEYLARQRIYMRMPLPKLSKTLGEMFEERYEKHNIALEVDYRIASAAYIVRTKTGGSLIYHLKNFLGSFVL